jgi:hypothetical protein
MRYTSRFAIINNLVIVYTKELVTYEVRIINSIHYTRSIFSEYIKSKAYRVCSGDM